MRLIILGAGGYGRVVADLAEQTGMYDEIHFLDDNSNMPGVLGVCQEFEKFCRPDTEMYPAFGNNEGRVAWMQRIKAAGIRIPRIIHRLAYVSPKAQVADGCVVMPYAVVNTGTIVKEACIVNVGALVDHDCILEEGCHIAPGGIVKAENHLPRETKIDSGEVVRLREYSMYGFL